jgi:RNA polymerase sigma-70 factor (ECF subfamily)
MEEDVQLLFAYARRGDVQSLAALVRRHATWMQALLRGMLPVAADVDDVFQETWMRVIRAAPRYRGGMVKPYLATVARSAAIDHLRRTRAVVSLDDEEGEGAGAATVAAEGPAPGEAFESQATSDDVRRAVGTLPEGPRQVLLMRGEAGLSFREIADELAIPLGTALTWMRSATLKLKRMLGGEK